MFESGLTPLAPVLISVLGAAITRIVTRFRPSRERDALALLMAGGTFVSTLLLARYPASRAVISPWQPLTLFGSQLVYTTEGLAAPFALLTSLVGLAVVLSLSKWRREADDNSESPLYPAIFVVSAAGLSFIYSANLITLCLSWAFLDLSLLFLVVGRGRNEAASDARGRALMVSSLTGLSLVVVALLLDGYGLSPALAPSLLLVAALLRVSFYPMHFWMLTDAEVEPSANILLQTVSIVTGLSLLARLQGLPYQSQLVTISSLASLATALSAWAEQDRRRAGRMPDHFVITDGKPGSVNAHVGRRSVHRLSAGDLLEYAPHHRECFHVTIVIDSRLSVGLEVEGIDHVDVAQIGGGGLVGHVHRVAQGHVPDWKGLELGVTGAHPPPVFVVDL